MKNAFTNRRGFLGGAALAITCGSSLAQKPSKPRRIRKAVKFQMVTETLTVMDKFKLLKDLGFDGTEVSTRSKLDRREISNAIEATGLPVHGVVNAEDPNLPAAIDLARQFGGDSVLVVAAEDKKRSGTQNFQHWQALIRRSVAHAEKNDVRLLIENVRATFLKTAEEMSRFVDSFHSPFVAAYFDTGNTITWTTQSAQHWASVLGYRIAKLDIKDRGNPQFGDARLRKPGAVGTDGGEVHWRQVRAQLANVNFSGWATAEVKGGDRNRLAGIAEWMDGVLGQ